MRYRSSRAFINYWQTIKPVVTSAEKSELTLPFMNALTKYIHSSV